MCAIGVACLCVFRDTHTFKLLLSDTVVDQNGLACAIGALCMCNISCTLVTCSNTRMGHMCIQVARV